VKTLPGSGGIETRDDSLSRMSRKCSKSLYRRRTEDDFSLNAGMLVCISYRTQQAGAYSADDLVVRVHFPPDA
jgi:hypothetical protein